MESARGPGETKPISARTGTAEGRQGRLLNKANFRPPADAVDLQSARVRRPHPRRRVQGLEFYHGT
jgi:hypothetical protein